MPFTLDREKMRDQADMFDIDTEAEDARSDLAGRAGMKNPPSEFQIDIFAELDAQIANYRAGQPTSSLAVEAVAGSGKTTTIVGAANLIPRDMKAMFLAFNKSIATELGERLPSHVKARTLNSLGFSLLAPYLKALGVSNINVQGSRTHALVRSILSFQEKDEFGAEVIFLVNMCKSMGVVPVGCTDGAGIDGMEATDDVLTQICIHHQRAIDPVIRRTVYAKAREVLAKSWSDINLYENGTIDFDDQKWLTVCKRPGGRTLAKPQFDIIFVDEVQDVNAVDIAMIQMVLKPNGVVIGVGDSRQAIYGFRGADTLAFDKFKSSFNAKTLPLSITYRCAAAIVEHAQQVVPTIQAAPNAPQGEVLRMETFEAEFFQAQDLVLCRNNAPLIEFAYKLIRARIPVQVQGRNIGDNLVRLINDLVAEKTWVPNPRKPGKKMPVFTVEYALVTELVGKLGEWLDTQIEAIREEDPDNEEGVQRVQDQYDSVMVFVEASVDNRVQSVVEQIESLFSDDAKADAVLCATIHKAKGLEADRVFMHRPDKMYPHWVESGTWQFEQERNLDYVARTRAKSLFAYLPVTK